jgi:hypothetical protein
VLNEIDVSFENQNVIANRVSPSSPLTLHLFLLLKQGSITGAYSPMNAATTTPSFILLAVQDTKVVCYVYELVNGEVEVSKTEFTKKIHVAGATTSTTNPALLDTLLK